MEAVFASYADGLMGIAAIAPRGATLPWPSCAEDQKHFRRVTAGAIVIMGRATWDSIPAANRPLRGRVNIVLSRSMAAEQHGDVIIAPDIDTLIEIIAAPGYAKLRRIVIGGADVFRQFMDRGLISIVRHTLMSGDAPRGGGAHGIYAPPQLMSLCRGASAALTSMINYTTILVPNHEETAFLELLGRAADGVRRPTRCGVAASSVFCAQLRFDLSRGRIPLLTTRPVPLRLIFHELRWILSGSTDVTDLQSRGIHIWDANSSAEFHAKNKTGLREWDIGPAYGFQLRHAGAAYVDCKTDYSGRGEDQLERVVDQLRHNPDSRRIMFSLWGAADIKKMALPPCAYAYQFRVTPPPPGAAAGRGQLSCVLTQRSSDIALAGGWNIATAALLTIMLAHVCDLAPHEVVWNPADIHVYDNQRAAVMSQLSRRPLQFPTLRITTPRRNITDFEWGDFALREYHPRPKIEFAMNA